MTSSNSVKKNILTLLKAKPELVENDNALLTGYWIVFDKVNRLSDIAKATPAETILRRFRELAEAGSIQVPRRQKKEPEERGFKSEFIALS